MARRARWLGFAAVVVIVAFADAAGSRPVAAPRIAAGFGGGALGPGNRLAIALPIRNEGAAAARDLRVAVSVAGAKRIAPKRLPVRFPVIPSQGAVTVFATFAGGFSPRQTRVIRIVGDFVSANGRKRFSLERRLRIPPRSPGKAVASAATSPAKSVRGGNFPHRNPTFGAEVNGEARWATPIGPFRQPPPRPKPTAPNRTKAFQGGERGQAGISFLANRALGVPSSTVNEPSGAVGKKVVFVTMNWRAAYATVGGGAFTALDPTTIFPQNGAVGGFCCDQIVQYVPKIDRIVWLMQQSAGMRIAAASPSAILSSHGTAWTYWDIPASQLGFGGFDYPDLAVGTNSLYASTDAGPGLLVIRIPLAEIGASATIHFRYTNPSNSSVAYFGHLAQNARDEIFWAGHNSSSSIRVFSWSESSNTYFWRDVSVGSWPNNPANMSSVTPDREDWLTKARTVQILWIAGLTRVFSTPQGRSVNQLWLAWSAPRGNGFPQPQVQIVVLDRSSNFRVVRQMQIWNPDYAFAYPALTSNPSGEVGLSLEYGGGARYENHVVGFWGDYVVYITTATTAGVGRFGDYVTIRPDPNDQKAFDAFGYGVLGSAVSPSSDTRYVAFRRP